MTEPLRITARDPHCDPYEPHDSPHAPAAGAAADASAGDASVDDDRAPQRPGMHNAADGRTSDSRRPASDFASPQRLAPRAAWQWTENTRAREHGSRAHDRHGHASSPSRAAAHRHATPVRHAPRAPSGHANADVNSVSPRGVAPLAVSPDRMRANLLATLEHAQAIPPGRSTLRDIPAAPPRLQAMLDRFRAQAAAHGAWQTASGVVGSTGMAGIGAAFMIGAARGHGAERLEVTIESWAHVYGHFLGGHGLSGAVGGGLAAGLVSLWTGMLHRLEQGDELTHVAAEESEWARQAEGVMNRARYAREDGLHAARTANFAEGDAPTSIDWDRVRFDADYREGVIVALQQQRDDGHATAVGRAPDAPR